MVQPCFLPALAACLQIKYVVELASALAKHPAVYRVDLLTRLIKDPKVNKSYGQEEECILKPEGAENDLGGAYIVRLPCGPVDQYIRYSQHLCSSTYASGLFWVVLMLCKAGQNSDSYVTACLQMCLRTFCCAYAIH